MANLLKVFLSVLEVYGRTAQKTKKRWADLGPTKNDSLVWARPGPDHRAGPDPFWPTQRNTSGPEPIWPREGKTTLGQHQPGPANTNGGEGIIFPPHLLHAETILHAGGKLMQFKGTKMQGEEAYLVRLR